MGRSKQSFLASKEGRLFAQKSKRRNRKSNYDKNAKIKQLALLFASSKAVYKCCMDHIPSSCKQKVGKELKKISPEIFFLKPKTTLVKVAIEWLTQNPAHLKKSKHFEFRKKLPYIPLLKKFKKFNFGNYGLIFSKEDISISKINEVLDKEEFSSKIPIRKGYKVYHDVIIPAGSTGLDPGKIEIFNPPGSDIEDKKKENIEVKVERGSIFLIQPFHLLKKGQNAGTRECKIARVLNLMFTVKIKIEVGFFLKTGKFLKIYFFRPCFT